MLSAANSPKQATASRQREAARLRYQRRKAAKEALRPPDPLLALSDLELAYIAGLIDGEGCLRIGLTSCKRSYFPTISVTMTHLGVIDWLRQKWNGHAIQHQKYTKPAWAGKWKEQHMTVLNGKRAQLLCRLLLPYLRVKEPQARIILGFPAEDRRGPGARLDPSIQARRSEAYHIMKTLNRRGPAPEED